MAGLVIRPRSRILHGHDWVYRSEILKIFGEPADGDVVSLRDGRDHLLGSAIYNSKSQIVARRFSRRRQDLDRDFFVRRITRAIEFRERSGVDIHCCRIVWSEADGLPGVVVDRYGPCAVLQTTTSAMDLRIDLIAGVVAELLGATCVIERNEGSGRTAEGLPKRTGVLLGEAPGEFEIPVAGARFLIDPLKGQKTGFYLDQVANYAGVARFAGGKRVLDCFSNQGGFAIACGVAGASGVVAVDSSAECIDRLARNVSLNGLSNIHARQADAFDFLAAEERRGSAYDLVVLDPPSFAKGRGATPEALRGYRDLHARAATLLAPGGLLATFSCSHHVPDRQLSEVIGEAFYQAKSSARLIRRFTQSPDHPILVAVPETEYLKGFLFEMLPGR